MDSRSALPPNLADVGAVGRHVPRRRRKASSSPSAASASSDASLSVSGYDDDDDGYSSDEDTKEHRHDGQRQQHPGDDDDDAAVPHAGLNVPSSSSSSSSKREKRFLLGYSGKTSTRWLLTLITGVTTGFVAIVIVFSIEELIKVREEALTWWEGEDFNDTKEYMSTFAAFSLWNLMLCTVSCALCMNWAPSAVGSGIPQTKAYLNGVAIHSFFNARTFFVKILGTVLSVSSGLCIGPEGPLVHLGAMVGAGLTRTGKLGRKVRALRRRHPKLAEALGMGSVAPPPRGQPPLPRRKVWLSSLIQYLSAFRNDGERRELISIGSACGFAAAFGAPIGAVLFSLEETSTFFNTKMLWRTVVGTMMSTFVVAIYFGKDLGHYGVLSLEGILVDESGHAKNKILELPLYAFVGAMGGIMGATFNHFFILLSKRRDAFYKGKHWSWRLVEVALLSLITSSVQYTLPLICGWSCRNNHETVDEGHANKDPNLAEEDFGNRFDCNTNQTNEMASIFFGSREEAIRNVLADPASFDVRTLLVVGCSFFVLLTITFGCAVPSGLFMPSILIGSCLGGAFGVGIRKSGWVYGEGVEPSTFALVGAAAMLGGVQRSTVSLCVILMEGTGQVKFLIPIVVATVAARYVGDHFNHGFYEIGMALKGYPYLEHHAHKAYDVHSIQEVMSAHVVTLNTVEFAHRIETVLKTCKHNGFPVTSEDGQFLGIVRRDQLAALLECAIFLPLLDPPTHTSDRAPPSIRDAALMPSEDLGRPRLSSAKALAALLHNSTAVALASGNDCDFRWDEGELKAKQDKSKRKLWAGSRRFSGTRPKGYSGNLRNLHERDSEQLEAALLMGDGRFSEGGANLPKGIRSPSPVDTPVASNVSEDVDAEDGPVSDNHAVLIDGVIAIDVCEKDKEREVDIASIMNIAPHVVLETTPLSRAYRLFTTMGLRHLVVLGEFGRVTGIVTRENLGEEFISERIGPFSH